MTDGKIRISQCMIVKNEEKNIERALSWGKGVVSEQIVVDTGHLAAMTATCQMEIKSVPGVKNMLFGGEGLFNTVISGPGKVWLQTMPISNVAGILRPYMPSGS